MSETPDPVSLKSLSLSGSDASLISDLFLRIDFDLLWVSFDPSTKLKWKIIMKISVQLKQKQIEKNLALIYQKTWKWSCTELFKTFKSFLHEIIWKKLCKTF